MEKFSVKKPFTVLVAVIMVLLLGFVAITKMQTDLLPNISTPYLMVVTVYPGGSPEQVEREVSSVMENALGTVTGVENITSTSAENYSIVQLQFAEDTNMDSAMVKVSNAVDQNKDNLPDICLTPSIMEVSMNMISLMTVSVGREGMDIYQLSDFIDNVFAPYVERKGGVSSISSTGLADKMIQVELNEDKIAEVNLMLLEQVNYQLAEAKKQLDAAEAQVNAGKKQLQQTKDAFGEMFSESVTSQLSASVTKAAENVRAQTRLLLANVNQLIAIVQEPEIQAALIEIRDGLESILDQFERTGIKTIDDLIEIVSQMRALIDNLNLSLQELQSRLEQESGGDGTGTAGDLVDALQLKESLENIYATLDGVLRAMDSVPAIMDKFQDAYADMTQAQLDAVLEFNAAQNMLTEAEKQLTAAKAQYEEARVNALASADVTNQLDIDTLATLIYAQNFSMPAGYIDDAEDNSWLLKVGEEYDSVEDLAGTLLLSVEGVGNIRLSDVADVAVIDNAEDTYTRLNGERATVLRIYKSSTASANEVSNNCLDAFAELEEKYEGLNVVVLANQGDYITMIVKSILSSMLLGALLAVVVLILFLKDIRPTLVVGISIPLSVLFAVVLVYFTNLGLNIMTLAGLSLGIGMLVDNSIVVIENIYRLRSRGVPAARAAVQGTRQVANSIIASTLTSVCVFLPVVFAQDMTRELLMPMALCIGYCLMASLVVAMTVAPAAASTVLKTASAKRLPWFEKIQEAYGRTLDWCLSHKLLPLAAAVLLLAFCCWRVISMGIVMLPEITSNEITITMNTSEKLTREESYQVAGQVMEAVMQVDNVAQVGVSTDTSVAGVDISQLGLPSSISSLLSGSGTYGSYSLHIKLEDNVSSSEIERARRDMEAALEGIDCESEVTVGGMFDLNSMMGSGGLSVHIYGSDLNTLEQISDELVEIINATEGFTGATNGLGAGDQTINLRVDMDKVRACGLTVAQIYQQIAAKLTTTTTANTSVTIDSEIMSVQITDNTDPLTVENLMDMTFTASVLTADGSTVMETHALGEFAEQTIGVTPDSIFRQNQTRYLTVSAQTEEGYNTTVQARVLQKKLDEYADAGKLPEGYTLSMGGEADTVNNMVQQMVEWMALALPFTYLVMVAQFQSLLSPFIVLFTIPLAFTGGLLGLLATGQQLSLMSLMGFVVLMGTVVNNGIVFVDYTNQLRLGGMDRRAALVATGKTRMRPILMTTLTTVLAMFQMVFSDDMAGQLMSGMAIVIIGGLTYATLMTLYIVPIMYDILFKRPPLEVDVGGDNLDDILDDAAEFLAASRKQGGQLNSPVQPVQTE